MADWVTKKLGRSPLQGMDETVWITVRAGPCGRVGRRVCTAAWRHPGAAGAAGCAGRAPLPKPTPTPTPPLPTHPPTTLPQWFLDRRRWVLANTGSEWAASVQRVDLYKWLLAAGGQQLGQPIRLTWDKCRPGGERGPCDPQPSKAELAIGGIIYGNFLLP